MTNRLKPLRYFNYGPIELDYLATQDPLLGEAIRSIGFIERSLTPDLFEALISSIVSQQIAKKAYFTVWARINELAGAITPENISALDRESLKACGLSYKKTDWIQTVAAMVLAGEIDLAELETLTNEELVKTLTKLPGIGVWTAEMLMIFALERPDVLSYGDLAIRRGIMNLYGLTELPKAQFETIRQRLSPYNSVASLYFWELSHEAKPTDSNSVSLGAKSPKKSSKKPSTVK